MKKPIYIDRALLARLCDRLEARLPETTVATHIEPGQREVNRRIEDDIALVDQARHLLRPNTSRPIQDFSTWTLEELRMGRECALKDGNTLRAFHLATAYRHQKGTIQMRTTRDVPRGFKTHDSHAPDGITAEGFRVVRSGGRVKFASVWWFGEKLKAHEGETVFCQGQDYFQQEMNVSTFDGGFQHLCKVTAI